ncbi:membrane protein [Scheffersomyces coipomensis]|uniref:uncharacterized protein n=1 Tax=Scheffersomyces coipomensis TaxID=1788519 RepID=UPI00315CBFFC
MNIRQLLLLTHLLSIVACLQTVPVIVASHKLVPDLKSEIRSDNLEAHNTTSVTNLIKKLITQCSSDEYVLVNIPGLTLDDVTDSKRDLWPYVRNYLKLSSTLVGLPWVHGTLNYKFLEKYIIKNCQAEAIYVNRVDDNEVQPYYDVRTRAIVVNLPPLPEQDDVPARLQKLLEYDELIRKILRKLPSPHFTLIISSDVTSLTHPVPTPHIKANPEDFEIFNEIVNHESRETEYERNDRFKSVEPVWYEPKTTEDRYLRNKKKDEIHLFNYELWSKNEKLVSTIIVMILGLFLMKFIEWFNKFKQYIIESNKRKNQLIIDQNKRID